MPNSQGRSLRRAAFFAVFSTDGENELSPEMMAVYQDAVDNLRFSKQQQWNITYYALLVYAAVFVLQDQPVFLTHQGKIFLTIIAGFAFLFSVFMLLDLQDRMNTFRRRVDRTHEKYFTTEQGNALDLVPDCRWQDLAICGALLVASFFGTAVVLLLVWAQTH